MNKFLLVDASHMFYRSRYGARGTEEEKIGMCLHILFSSLGKAWRVQKANHVVFAFDGRSWRKDHYSPYKNDRPEATDEDRLFFAAFEVFKTFIKEHTNCTTLYNSDLEADDLIAGFIQAHPNDQHVIVSGDGDFVQLLSSNVSIYDGMNDTTTTLTGIVDWKGQPVKGKDGLPKAPPNPEWSLFEKCIRGCSTDHIFPAYPKARVKSSKTKIGLEEAFNDRHKKGYAWSAVMMYRWLDHNNEEHTVLEDYNRNVKLIDLSKQPEEIREKIAETIANFSVSLSRLNIGIYLLKLYGKYELVKLSENTTEVVALLKAAYPTHGQTK